MLVALNLVFSLVAEFISPPKVYTFGFIAGITIPKSVECIHSATKVFLSSRILGFYQPIHRASVSPDTGLGPLNSKLKPTSLDPKPWLRVAVQGFGGLGPQGSSGARFLRT